MTRTLYVIKSINSKYFIGTTYHFPLTMMYIFKYNKYLPIDKPFYVHKKLPLYNTELKENEIISNIVNEYVDMYGYNNVIKLS